MLKIFLLILFVYFWITNSWAQVVMDFFTVQDYLYIIGVINVLFPIILFALVLRFYIIPFINSYVFNNCYKTIYRLLNESVSLSKHKEECEKFKEDLTDIKHVHDQGTPFKGWTTWFVMLKTLDNVSKFIMAEKIKIK